MIPCNAPTRWEIELSHEDGRTLALGFTARHTRRAIFSAMIENGERICQAIGDGDFGFEWHSATGRFVCDGAGKGWSVRFGRTEREIKNAGIRQ